MRWGHPWREQDEIQEPEGPVFTPYRALPWHHWENHSDYPLTATNTHAHLIDVAATTDCHHTLPLKHTHTHTQTDTVIHIALMGGILLPGVCCCRVGGCGGIEVVGEERKAPKQQICRVENAGIHSLAWGYGLTLWWDRWFSPLRCRKSSSAIINTGATVPQGPPTAVLTHC